jgi:hypothetical protein
MLVPTYQAIRYHIPEDFSFTEDRLLLCLYLLHIPSVSPVSLSHQCQLQLASHQDMNNLACLLECRWHLGLLVICVCSKQNHVLM